MSANLEGRINPGILGIHPYVPGKTIQEAIREVGDRDFIKLASNENPLGISPRAAEAVRRAVAEAFRYPEKSCAELRQALARRLDLSPDHLIIGNGADGILYTLAMTLIAEGDEVVIPEVTFSFYEVVARAMRARVVPSAMRGPAIDLEDIRGRLTPRTKAVFLCNPNNPTGTMIGRDELYAFARALPEGVFLVHDEVYADFADPEQCPRAEPLIREGRHNVFIVRSFSKLHGLAGVRAGYGVGTPELVALMNRVRPPFEVSVLAQAAALAALEDEEFQRETLALTRREKRFLYGRLAAMGLDYVPSHTNFILIDIGPGAGEASRALIDGGVIVRAYSDSRLSEYIRLTIGTREQNLRFLRSLQQWLNERKG
jgi:histidinol-phosphate aminotransferase